MKKYKIYLVWGEEDSRKAGEGDWNGLTTSVCLYEFDTQQELDAFAYGVNEANGWADAHQLNADEIIAATKAGAITP